jgi:AI-2 transport protein TqsA
MNEKQDPTEVPSPPAPLPEGEGGDERAAPLPEGVGGDERAAPLPGGEGGEASGEPAPAAVPEPGSLAEEIEEAKAAAVRAEANEDLEEHTNPIPRFFEETYKKIGLGRRPEEPEPGRASRPVGAEQGILVTGSLLVIAAVAITVALIWARAVMVPFVLALLLTYMVTPIVDLLQTRLRVPRPFALLVAFLVIAGGVTGLVLLLVTSVQGLADNADQYERTWTQLLLWAERTYLDLSERLPVDLGFEEQVAELTTKLGELPLLALGWAKDTAGGVLNFLSTTFLVLIFVIYLILGHTPAQQRKGLWGEVDRKVRRYIVTKVLTSATTGLLTGVLLWLLGVDLALVFGMTAFLLNFIPSIGSIIATLLPLPIALMQFGFGWELGAVLVLPGAVQMTIGNGIEPKIMGDSLDLHPITILLTLIFWGLVWGPVGMLLAAPITAVLKIILERFDTTRPVASLLAGRLPEI